VNDDQLRAQINELIRDEIQQGINEYLDQQETEGDKEPELGFANPQEEANELKVNIPKDEVDRLLKEYKRIKKNEKSNFAQIKKLGLVDKHGNPL
tara:strand:- start:1323 stop:1607 length:285 start_codon:yes stop_codon:yes gene_type:complete